MSFYKTMMAGFDPLLAGIVFEGEGDGGGGDGDNGGDGGNGGDNSGGGGGGEGDNAGGDGGDGGSGDVSWRDTITDESLRAIGDRFNSPTDAIQAIADLRKRESTSIRIPGDDAKPEEIAKFNKALGVPDDVKGYEFKMPEGKDATEADIAFQGQLAEIFHKAGIPAAAASKLNDLHNELAMKAEEAQVAADKQFVEETTAALQTKWGTDFERNKNLSSRAAKYLLGDNFEAAQQMEMKDGRFLLDHPVFMEMLAKAGAEMDEDGFQKMDPEGAATVQEDINSLNQELHKAHLAGDSKKAGELNTKVQALYQKLHGSQGAVGEGGRTA